MEYFTLYRVKAATNGFEDSRLLGTGGFAKVYLGVETTRDGEMRQFAVKVARSKVRSKKLQHEIELVARFRHPNLVRFIGHCHERENSTNREKKQILIYEYAANGSLHSRLADKEKREVLSLDARIRIAEGTARAIAFLHENNLIHCDVKPENILLNENMEALLADFGALELQLPKFSTVASRLYDKGTSGYVDPQYVLKGSLSPACDVYRLDIWWN